MQLLVPTRAAFASPFAFLPRAVPHHLGIWLVSAHWQINNSGPACSAPEVQSVLHFPECTGYSGNGKAQITLEEAERRAKTWADICHPAAMLSPAIPSLCSAGTPQLLPELRGTQGTKSWGRG